MANPLPIVCVFLKLPPSEQIFFRIRELSEIFVNKVDQLTMVVAASHSANTSPVAVQAVQGLREDAAKHCMELSKTVFHAYKFAIIYLGFMENLSPPEVTDQNFIDIHSTYIDASVEVDMVEAARKVMGQFKQDIADVITRIKVALQEGNDTGEVFTAENGQTVTELFQAIDECNNLLRELGDFHTDMKARTATGKEQEIRTCMPSEEEITMVRERWDNYSTNVKAVNKSFRGVTSKLLSAEGIKQADHGSNNNHYSSDEAVPPTSKPNPMNEGHRQNLITGPKAPDPSLVKPRVSFWRSFLQCIYSCLTLKCFR